MNNNTTARAPLRASETVSVLEQQIQGNIKRDGAGPFYNIEMTETKAEAAPKKARKTKKKE